MVEQFEEVPGSRTTQPTQVQPGKADEIAYRDLKPGEVIQASDEWRSTEGGTACWQGYHSDMVGKTLSEFCVSKARRPYNITELLKQRDQAAHEYRLYREALDREQAAHKITMANGLQACKERDDAEQALKMARAALEKTSAARTVIIEERNEAERLLTQARAAQERIITERDEWRRLFEVEHEARQAVIAERDECQQQRQHLQTALEELQRRRDAAAGVDAMTVKDVVENILSALEIASHALEYLADVGVNEEAGHYSGFSAAIAVVQKIKEAAK